MRKVLGLFVIVILAVSVIASVFVIAMPVDRVNANTRGGASVQIPVHAVEVAEGIFFLGSSVDPQTGKAVEGYALFHHRDGHNGGPGNDNEDPASSCYSFIANGAKWNEKEDYLVDSSNSRGLNETSVKDIIAADIGKWEDAVSNIEIFGVETTGTIDSASIGISSNGQNEVIFADIDSNGAIGVTIVWGIFRGKPSDRGLVEWDMVFDDVDFDWSLTGEAGKMDFDNIANHEMGHALGMGHPSNDCTEETMFASAGFGETKKRSLEAGDIAGIIDLYS